MVFEESLIVDYGSSSEIERVGAVNWREGKRIESFLWFFVLGDHFGEFGTRNMIKYYLA